MVKYFAYVESYAHLQIYADTSQRKAGLSGTYYTYRPFLRVTMAAKKIILDLPPSGNTRLMPIKGRMINSPKYRQWKETASWSVKAQLCGAAPIDKPVMTVIKLVYKNNRRRDYDNVVKCVNDALTQGGAIADDSLIYCAFTYRDKVDKEHGDKVEIELYQLNNMDSDGLDAVQANLSQIMESLAKDC